MSLDIYTAEDLELIRLIRNGLTNNGLCYQMDWNLGTLKTRLELLFKLAEVSSKTALKAKFKGVDLTVLTPNPTNL
jgi:DNA-binding NarL/FixJ family response regulator